MRIVAHIYPPQPMALLWALCAWNHSNQHRYPLTLPLALGPLPAPTHSGSPGQRGESIPSNCSQSVFHVWTAPQSVFHVWTAPQSVFHVWTAPQSVFHIWTAAQSVFHVWSPTAAHVTLTCIWSPCFRERPQAVSLVMEDVGEGEGGGLLGLPELDNEVDVS